MNPKITMRDVFLKVSSAVAEHCMKLQEKYDAHLTTSQRVVYGNDNTVKMWASIKFRDGVGLEITRSFDEMVTYIPKAYKPIIAEIVEGEFLEFERDLMRIMDLENN